jgi:hypothetical protein
VSQADALKLATTDCLLQAQAIEEAAGVELHIAALEKAQGKKLTKAQRELVTMSYNLANGETVDEQVEQEEPKEKVVEEPTNETSNETSSSEGTDTSIESSGVEEEEDLEPKPEPTPEVSEDPIADAVEEIAQEEGTNVDDDLQSALDALGI